MASNTPNTGSTRAGKKVFCLAHAPNAEAAEQVHREAHGMMAEKIIEVQPESQKYSSAALKQTQRERSFCPAAEPMSAIPESERFCSPTL